MVQVLYPTDLLAHKPRAFSFRCSPLTRRRTLPTTRDLIFSQSFHQNAVERAALRKLTTQILATKPSLPNLAPSYSLPSVLSTSSPPSFISVAAGISNQAEEVLPQEIPGTPATPLETGEHCPELKYQPEIRSEPKANIFNNTTKSDALLGPYEQVKLHLITLIVRFWLDLMMAALERIYIDDYSDAMSWENEHQLTASVQAPAWPAPRVSISYCDSPPSMSSSASSSVSSTPSTIPTPACSPALEPEIACESTRTSFAKAYATGGLGAAKPLTRTHSAPLHGSLGQVHAPKLGDKDTLRWFLVELLRRSRASASVVQLALHYLSQARGPVGDILQHRFKSETRQGQEDSQDSPLLDPRRLLLAALMLSTKLLHDHAPNNRAWARVCGLAPRDIGACERALGQALDWKLANMFVGPRDNEPILD